jgi:hypothetical protein
MSSAATLNLEKTARFLVELKVKDRTDDIGLPVEVLRIDYSGATGLPPRPRLPRTGPGPLPATAAVSPLALVPRAHKLF